MADRLSGPHMPIMAGVVACAVTGCKARSIAMPALDDEGQPRLSPPGGWGEITATLDHGDGSYDEFQMFVCSPSCERRLAMRLAQPSHGTLN